MRRDRLAGTTARVWQCGYLAALIMLCGVSTAGATPRQEEEMAKKELQSPTIRPPAVAGAFYPADAEALADQIRGFLRAVPSRSLPGSIKALIVPHAGYEYSGQVAAHAYKLLEGMKCDTVIVIAPSHRYSFRGASVYPRGAYQIPLGLIPINHALTEQLVQASEHITTLPEAHAREHSLEVQLPFLKMVLGDFSLIPLIMGSCDYAACDAIAAALYRVIKDRPVLIVASSDLSHYHPYQTAVTLDQTVINFIKNFDPKGLYNALTTDTCEACGALPIITTLLCAQKLGATRAVQLCYANSGDVSGDKSAVVGYVAAALHTPSASSPCRPGDVDFGLTDDEKQLLHTIARTAIESGCTGKSVPELPPLTARLREKRGAFVTLHKRDNLRGCIGYIRAQKPLFQTIQEMAHAAAFQDSRFRPVTRDELKDISIEISVLTPLKKISRIEEIEVGRDGIYIVKDFHSGLLLPQVATENKWDRETFLRHTCAKAGLPDNAWEDPATEMYIFSADIF